MGFATSRLNFASAPELRVEALRDATPEDGSRVELQDALLVGQRLLVRSDAYARLGALDNFKRAALRAAA